MMYEMRLMIPTKHSGRLFVVLCFGSPKVGSPPMPGGIRIVRLFQYFAPFIGAAALTSEVWQPTEKTLSVNDNFFPSYKTKMFKLFPWHAAQQNPVCDKNIHPIWLYPSDGLLLPGCANGNFGPLCILWNIPIFPRVLGKRLDFIFCIQSSEPENTISHTKHLSSF